MARRGVVFGCVLLTACGAGTVGGAALRAPDAGPGTIGGGPAPGTDGGSPSCERSPAFVTNAGTGSSCGLKPVLGAPRTARVILGDSGGGGGTSCGPLQRPDRAGNVLIETVP